MTEQNNKAIINILQNLLPKFSKVYKEEMAKIPYDINVIDELRADENAHSRIFVKLLQYKDNNTYPFLELFLKSLGGDFENIEVKNPIFSAEKLRIDILIREYGKYGLIIENKIHGAVDQNSQIENYINKIKKFDPEDNKIFIVYLTRQGGSPDEKSFSKKDKERFDKRYVEISFKHHVLPLLEDTFLPVCRLKETNLISAIQQYIDHLKGILRLRNNQQAMNEELKKHLHKVIELLEENSIINIENNFTKLKEINSTASELSKTIDSMFFKCKQDYFMTLCENEIKKTYEIEVNNTDVKYIRVLLKYQNIVFYSMIGEDEGDFYYSCRNKEWKRDVWKKGDAINSLLNEVFKEEILSKHLKEESDNNIDYCSLVFKNLNSKEDMLAAIEKFINYTKKIEKKNKENNYQD